MESCSHSRRRRCPKAMTSAREVGAASVRVAAPVLSAQKVPSLFIGCVLAGWVGGPEADPPHFPVYDESCGDDVPKVLQDDINRQEVEFSRLVRLTGTTGRDLA